MIKITVLTDLCHFFERWIFREGTVLLLCQQTFPLAELAVSLALPNLGQPQPL